MFIRKVKKIINNPIFKGSIAAIFITLMSLLFFSFVLVNVNISELVTNIIIIVIMAISVLVGSIISSRKIKKKGIINGGIVGLVYIIFLYLISSIVIHDFTFNLYTIISFIASILGGIIGGIIGVNL